MAPVLSRIKVNINYVNFWHDYIHKVELSVNIYIKIREKES